MVVVEISGVRRMKGCTNVGVSSGTSVGGEG